MIDIAADVRVLMDQLRMKRAAATRLVQAINREPGADPGTMPDIEIEGRLVLLRARRLRPSAG